MSTPANPDVYAWRWFPNSSDVNAPGTPLAAINTSYEVPIANLGVSHFLYAGVDNTGDMSATGSFTLEYEESGNPGTWVAVTTTSSFVRVIDGLATDADAITASQLGAGAGTFTNGDYDDVNGSNEANIGGAQYTNFAWSIEFRSADLSGGESINLRVLEGGVVCDNDSGATINVTIAAPSGDIAATGPLAFTTSADLDATGTLASTGALAFTTAADLDAVGELTAAAALTVTSAADLDAIGELLATGAAAFTSSADLDATGEVNATGAIAFTSSADLGSLESQYVGRLLAGSYKQAVKRLGNF